MQEQRYSNLKLTAYFMGEQHEFNYENVTVSEVMWKFQTVDGPNKWVRPGESEKSIAYCEFPIDLTDPDGRVLKLMHNVVLVKYMLLEGEPIADYVQEMKKMRKEYDLKQTIETKKAKGEGLRVVISGCFTTSALGHYGRTAARQTIEGLGYKVQSEINKSTDYLCVGTANVPGRGVGPSKLKTAKAMGIAIVTIEELKKLAA